MATLIHVSVVSGKASKSLLSRRERLSQPNVRSTIQRPHCSTCKPSLCRGRFTITSVRGSIVATHATSLPAYPPSAQRSGKSRKAGHECPEHRLGPITVLHPRRMPDHNEEQPEDIDHDVPLVPADALASIIAPFFFFSGLHRLAVNKPYTRLPRAVRGLGQSPRRVSCIRSQTPARRHVRKYW